MLGGVLVPFAMAGVNIAWIVWRGGSLANYFAVGFCVGIGFTNMIFLIVQ
jgi:hypothetical protein